jgi:prepilin-type N-terminal cleavage/methylation domain-containing protein
MNSPLTRLRFPTCAAVQRSSSRGFTLLEIMTVVVIIGVFAVLALPSMVFRLRDRKTSAVGQQLATMYRTARMRAIGRGSTVLVR